jgi:hypothetical protein
MTLRTGGLPSPGKAATSAAAEAPALWILAALVLTGREPSEEGLGQEAASRAAEVVDLVELVLSRTLSGR